MKILHTFAAMIAQAYSEGAPIQLIPLRTLEMKNGCLIRFRMGTAQ